MFMTRFSLLMLPLIQVIQGALFLTHEGGSLAPCLQRQTWRVLIVSESFSDSNCFAKWCLSATDPFRTNTTMTHRSLMSFASDAVTIPVKLFPEPWVTDPYRSSTRCANVIATLEKGFASKAARQFLTRMGFLESSLSANPTRPGATRRSCVVGLSPVSLACFTRVQHPRPTFG